MKSATATFKTKKSSTLNSAQKGQLSKQKKNGLKSRLVKSTPGFSLYTSNEITKPTSKSKEAGVQPTQPPQGPRLMNGDPFEAVSCEDNIVSQVQLVEKRSRARPVTSRVHITTNASREDKTRSNSPDLAAIPGLSEVRTPFNRRLISSTPDPERQFLTNVDDLTNLPQTNQNVENPNPASNSSPQMVPEKDTESCEKQSISSTTTMDIISSMLSTQRQNQILWQQQLEQFKQPLAVVKDINHKPPPLPSAFQQWSGLPRLSPPTGFVDANAGLASGEIRYDRVEENKHQKAKWVTEDSCIDDVKKTDQKSLNNYDSQLSADKKVNPLSCNTASSNCSPTSGSVQTPINEIVSAEFFLPKSQDNLKMDTKPDSGREIDCVKRVVVSKSKGESNQTGQSKISSSSSSTSSSSTVINSKTSKFGVKVLPVTTRNAQQNSRQQLKSNVQRKVAASKKQQQDKVSTVVEVSDSVKKKKVLHVNLPRDERGTDVPPGFSLDDEANDVYSNDICATPIPDYKGGMKMHGNDSVMSTCGAEVNSLLSIESKKSSADSSVETKSIATSESKAEEKELVLSGFIQSTKKEFDVNYDLLRKDLNKEGVATHNSPIETNIHENMNSEENHVEKEVIQYKNDKILLEDDKKCEKKEDEIVVEENAVETVEEKLKVNENEEGNVNQNYHDDQNESGEGNTNQNYYDYQRENHGGDKRYRLHFLEKMADKSLMDIVCKLTLKATAIRDKELRDLIDDLVYNTDATLAREDGRFQSSQAFFMEENNKLKKRLHNVNKQLEAKERQERQADLFPGISNNDVMHLERKNLYLRQEKDRLDSQVTNLLEEKARWLIKQQDLVKTISLKDREILKLEGKFQEEKKSLHKAVDEAAKNSQGVHFKLSVADREISNLEQRLKTKDIEIADLKDDLKCCVDGRSEKNKEIQRLEELVNTLKIGVDEVMKAYEATAYSQPSTSGQRQGIESLRRLVTESLSAASSISHIPQHVDAMDERWKTRQSLSSHPLINNDAIDGRQGFSISTSTRQELPSFRHQNPPRGQKDQVQRVELSQPKQKQSHQQSHQQQKQQQQHTPKRDTHARGHTQAANQRARHGEEDWYARDSSLIKNKSKGGMRSRHGSGSALTVQALVDHNRRLSPVDRNLWHSLDTGHVTQQPFTGDEPYYSDSEIHMANSKTRRRMRMAQERLNADVDVDARERFRYRDCGSRSRQRRKSDDFTEKKRFRSEGTGEESRFAMGRRNSNGRNNGLVRFEDRVDVEGQVDRDRGRGGWDMEGKDERLRQERRNRCGAGYDSKRRNEVSNFDERRCEPDEEMIADLESITINNEDNRSDLERTRYSVTDYFQKYPTTSTQFSYSQRQQEDDEAEKTFPVNSKEYWIDSGTADDPNETMTRENVRRPLMDDSRAQSLYPNEQYPSLESMSISDQQALPQDRQEILDPQEREAVYRSQQPYQQFTDKMPQRSIRDGQLIPMTNRESNIRGPKLNPLSSSYPTLRSEEVSSRSNKQPMTASGSSFYPSLMSTSLPHSSQQQQQQYRHSERTRRDDEINIMNPNLNPSLPSRLPPSPNQIDFHRSSDFDDRIRGENRAQNRERLRDDNIVEDSRQMLLSSQNNDRHNDRQCVTFRRPSTEESLANHISSQFFQSDFLTGRESFPPHSSPVNTSDVSVSRRATRGSQESQQDFFRGTELSASYSSISDTDPIRLDYSTNNENAPLELGGEDSFSTGIASLDTKIAQLEAKFKRTKAVFS